MMRFQPGPEPRQWDAKCRTPGRNWLAKHPGYARPRDYWSRFEPDLHQAFGGLCSYCAMYQMKVQMDHFLPVAHLKKVGKDDHAYEWDNFRASAEVLNQRKSDHLILDPFDVKDDWFEILLPSLQLDLTDKVPKSKKVKAQFTIERLGLDHGEVVIRYRLMWFELYKKRRLDLAGLRNNAPLIARAIERDLQRGKDWRDPPAP